MGKALEWHPISIEFLKDPEESIAYLNAALQEDDPRIFLIAIKDVIEAQSSISDVAKKAKLSRQGLYKILSDKGNPTIENISRVLNSMGIHFGVHR